MNEETPEDLAWLRRVWPSWRFGASWSTAGSGPDRRVLYAQRGERRLTAWSAAELSASLRREASD